MQYRLVNAGLGNLQINLYSPEISHKNVSLNRPGPTVALTIKRGESVDLLKYFKTPVEARASLYHSKDALAQLKPGTMYEYACDDNGNQVKSDELVRLCKENESGNKNLRAEPVYIDKAEVTPVNSIILEIPAISLEVLGDEDTGPVILESVDKKEDVTVPAMEVSANLASMFEFEEQKKIEPNTKQEDDKQKMSKGKNKKK